MPGRLDGKVALITGGGSGIGRATAVLFAAEGARAVVVVDRNGDGAQATATAIADAAPACAVDVSVADVTDTGAPATTVAGTLDTHGGLDVVLTAAGLSVGQTLADTTPAEWEQVFTVNVTGTYLWLRAAIPPMVEQGSGSIITIASQLAINGGRANTAYIASKGAVIAMTRTTALDLARTGVRVNSILPGATETPLLERSFGRLADPERARARSLARHPMGRFGKPEEIAQAALYLASDESSFTTGTEIRVDGGWISG
ncbi:MAG: glucose 1-dehydrogenase [Acidimicrobiia bacterium]|nr:glucose 1-dehydrogenase [Acidimicrobiia bacterium]